MLGTVKISTENSVFSIRRPENFCRESWSQKKSGNLWCNHCQRSNHSRDKCWKLHGKYDNWNDTSNNRRDTKGHQVTTDMTSWTSDNNFNFSLSKEQMEQLYQILNAQSSNQSQSTTQGQQSQPALGTSLSAQKGTFMTAVATKWYI